MKTLKDYTRIIVETDDDAPVVIAEITAGNVEAADGFRVRLRPKYKEDENEEIGN